jgi:hypothetical protein
MQTYGSNPFTIQERSDPGEHIIHTESFITLQTFGSSNANPGNMNVVRAASEGFRRTLAAIRNLPECGIGDHWN